MTCRLLLIELKRRATHIHMIEPLKCLYYIAASCSIILVTPNSLSADHMFRYIKIIVSRLGGNGRHRKDRCTNLLYLVRVYFLELTLNRTKKCLISQGAVQQIFCTQKVGAEVNYFVTPYQNIHGLAFVKLITYRL